MAIGRRIKAAVEQFQTKLGLAPEPDDSPSRVIQAIEEGTRARELLGVTPEGREWLKHADPWPEFYATIRRRFLNLGKIAPSLGRLVPGRNEDPRAGLILILNLMIDALREVDPPAGHKEDAPPAPAKEGSLVEEMRRRGWAQSAALVEAMSGKTSVDIDTIKGRVHGDPLVRDGAVSTNVSRTNTHLGMLKSSLKFGVRGGNVMRLDPGGEGSGKL